MPIKNSPSEPVRRKSSSLPCPGCVRNTRHQLQNSSLACVRKPHLATWRGHLRSGKKRKRRGAAFRFAGELIRSLSGITPYKCGVSGATICVQYKAPSDCHSLVPGPTQICKLRLDFGLTMLAHRTKVNSPNHSSEVAGSTMSLCTLHHAPCTTHPTPHTLHYAHNITHHTPCTLHPTPHTLHPTAYSLHHPPHNLHPALYTIRHTPYTLLSTPYTIPCRCCSR